jgi:hypothetical protein
MKALSSLLLVVATAAMGLGMAAVTASLLPGAGAHPDALDRRPISRDVRLEPDAAHIEADGVGRRPWKSPQELGGIATPAELPRGSVARPWVSPLYPQNGVTLWDRVRVSPQRNRRAFLLGTAIQVHAPAVAATPGTELVHPQATARDSQAPLLSSNCATLGISRVTLYRYHKEHVPAPRSPRCSVPRSPATLMSLSPSRSTPWSLQATSTAS